MGEKSPFRRVHAPPKFKRVTEIVTISPTEPLEGVVVSTKVMGIMTHWDGKRTRPCLDTDGSGGCPGCDAQQPSRYQGFLELRTKYGQKNVFVALTPGAADELEESHGSVLLRGRTVRIWRERRSKRSPLRVMVLQEVPVKSNVPKETSLEETLRRIFGME